MKITIKLCRLELYLLKFNSLNKKNKDSSIIINVNNFNNKNSYSERYVYYYVKSFFFNPQISLANYEANKKKGQKLSLRT